MDSALSIIGFYFTLIGFISGLFFTRLDSWYGQVREFWGSMKLLEKSTDKINKSKEARIKMIGLQQSAPQGSFIAVGSLTTALTILSLWIPIASSAVNPFIFLRIPLFFTVLMYWVGGILLLHKGRDLLIRVSSQIDQVLPEQMAS
jgi:hypothetical protein